MNLSELNEVQIAAVKCLDSPVLIYAGAGSGKTRVLAHKIAYLVEFAGMAPENILAVTFTNKAANEMKNRVAALLPKVKDIKGKKNRSPSRQVAVGTFHSICARLLRNEIEHLGYHRDFVIYDKDDQIRLIKSVLEQHELDTQAYPPQYFQPKFSNAKNALEGAADLKRKVKGRDGDILAAVFDSYQKALRRNNALDSDDLLLLPLELFATNPDVLDRYCNQYQYILVDEYQDTNRAQFEFIRYLALENRRITVVGDDDQSIYGWRGADIRNILDFHKTFTGAEIFKLEQNYRSSDVILKAAHEVVSRNNQRTDKKLWTEQTGGELIGLIEAEDERQEAEIIFQR